MPNVRIWPVVARAIVPMTGRVRVLVRPADSMPLPPTESDGRSLIGERTSCHVAVGATPGLDVEARRAPSAPHVVDDAGPRVSWKRLRVDHKRWNENGKDDGAAVIFKECE